MSLVNEIAHLYIGVERMTLPAASWVLLVDEVMALKGVGNAAHEQLQTRGNLDTFTYVPDDPQTEEDETVMYSNLYIFEAQFPANSIDFDKFKTRLVNLFGVDPALVTYTTGTTTIVDRQTVFATYKYNNINRIRIGLFGCEDDNTLCTWEQSRVEADGNIMDNLAEWGETVQ